MRCRDPVSFFFNSVYMHTYTDCFHAKDEIDLVFLSEFTALTCKYDTFLHTVMKRACLHAFVLFFFVGDALYAVMLLHSRFLT